MVMAAVAAGAIGSAVIGSAMAPSAPQTPNYGAAAQAQGQSNIQAALLSTQLNRPNQITPYGSSLWYQGAQPNNPQATYSWTPYNSANGAPASAPQPGQSYYGGMATTQPVSGAPSSSTQGLYGLGSELSAHAMSQPTGNSPWSGASVGGGAPLSSGSGMAAPPQPGAVEPGQYSNNNPGTYGGGAVGPQNGNYAGYGNSGYNPSTGQYNNSEGSGYAPQDTWTNVQSLSPTQQALFDSQNYISQDMANQGMSSLGQVNSSLASPASSVMNGLDPLQQQIQMSNVPAVPTDTSQQNTDAYNALMSRQNTQFGIQQEQLANQLANEGITPGSTAYNNAMMPLQQSEVDASNQAEINAGQLQQQQFNMASQANQQQFGENQAQAQFGNQALAQGLSENTTLRELPLNELNALRSGAQVTAPSWQAYSQNSQVAATPVLQGAQLQAGANQQTYSNQVGQYNNTMQGLYSLGSAYMYSDRRLKADIVRTGTTAKGLPWYDFTFLPTGERRSGVLADEVERSIPGAVAYDENGFAMVDYSRVH